MTQILGDIFMDRGDSYPLEMRIKDKATKEYIDLTGYTFVLTVDPSKTPIDDTNNVFQVPGVLGDQVSDTGLVSFTPTAANTDHVGIFYYDIQMIDADSNRRTIPKHPKGKKYKFTLGQDISK